MKKLLVYRIITCKIILFFVIIIIMSCINQEEKYNNSLHQKKEDNTESTIDFNLISYLNEANKKTIELATITFYQIKDRETLQLVLKIKKDHQKMDTELKKLAERNLIIIPQIVYNMEINSDSIKRKNIDIYFLNLLGNQIKNQIALLQKIEKSSQNTDFKTLAVKSKIIIQSNSNALQTYIPTFYKQKNNLD